MKSGLHQLVAAYLPKERIAGQITFIRDSAFPRALEMVSLELLLYKIQNKKLCITVHFCAPKELVVIVEEVGFLVFIVVPGTWDSCYLRARGGKT